MDKHIIESVKDARKLLQIEDFPGCFFDYITETDFMENSRILLFKEDIDELSGFIGYGPNELAAICINYKRNIGHQNFTLAHELGHWFLHRGVNSFDNDGYITSEKKPKIEKEASNFAGELLYPQKLADQDYKTAKKKDLFDRDNRALLGDYVDELCHKYGVSYDFVLKRLLFMNGDVRKSNVVRREIETAIGSKISSHYDKTFYLPDTRYSQYKALQTPYEKLIDKVEQLRESKDIGNATAEAIINRYRMVKK